MDDSSRLSRIEYYKRLYNQQDKEQESMFETLADKLLGVLDVQVFDFGQKLKHEVFIDRVRSSENVLMLKKPLKIVIEKFEGGYSVLQKEILIVTFADTFRDALRKFQDQFYCQYQYYKSIPVESIKDVYLKQLFSSLVNLADS